MSVKTEVLSGMPLYPVTYHGRPNFSSDGYTKARSIMPARRINHYEMAISDCLSCFGQLNERSMIQDSVGLGKKESAQKRLFLYN